MKEEDKVCNQRICFYFDNKMVNNCSRGEDGEFSEECIKGSYSFCHAKSHSQAKNIKNKQLYQVLDVNVANCTNANEGQRMVLYQKDGVKFVREFSEFIEKFELLESK